MLGIFREMSSADTEMVFGGFGSDGSEIKTSSVSGVNDVKPEFGCVDKASGVREGQLMALHASNGNGSSDADKNVIFSCESSVIRPRNGTGDEVFCGGESDQNGEGFMDAGKVSSDTKEDKGVSQPFIENVKSERSFVPSDSGLDHAACARVGNDVASGSVEPHLAAADDFFCQLLDDVPGVGMKVTDFNLHLPYADSIISTPGKEASDVPEDKVPEFGIQAEGLQNKVKSDKDGWVHLGASEAGVPDMVGNKSCMFNAVGNGNKSAELSVKSVTSRGDFSVSDMVWGKVRSHPWWPGQIFDPSAASEKAKKGYKEGRYLIAYFGDQTFAWNDAARIKPFQAYFSRFEKQSNSPDFVHAVHCALEEVTRRVEFGLACSCLPEEVYAKNKTQKIVNAGIHDEPGRRDGEDGMSDAVSFEPLRLVTYISTLAESPCGEVNRLEYVTARAQLSAFVHWKYRSSLPEIQWCNEFLDKKTGFVSGLHSVESVSDMILNGESEAHIPFKKGSLSNEDGLSHKRKRTNQDEGKSRKKVKTKSGKSPHKSRNENVNERDNFCPEEMLSQLYLAARGPLEGFSSMIPLVSFILEFRRTTNPEYTSLLKDRKVGDMSAKPGEAGDTSEFECAIDSYWTDRLIQIAPEEQPEKKSPTERVVFQSPADPFPYQNSIERVESRLDNITAGSASEALSEDLVPTALVLRFADLNSVSEANLNQIFSQFGELNESETKIMKKSNSAKVVFKKRSDAEKAFSSAGKYRAFGPSLVSYRLKYLPPRKSRPRPTKRKRDA